MEYYKYLIVGGGMTADAAVRGIRGTRQRRINRAHLRRGRWTQTINSPLSKGLWKGKELESIWRKTAEVAGVTLHLRTTATRIRRERATRRGSGRRLSIPDKKLLLATGGSPRHLPFGTESIIYFEHLTITLAPRSDRKGDWFAAIGGGFIGSEIAAALRQRYTDNVSSMIFPETGIGPCVHFARICRIRLTHLTLEKKCRGLDRQNRRGSRIYFKKPPAFFSRFPDQSIMVDAAMPVSKSHSSRSISPRMANLTYPTDIVVNAALQDAVRLTSTPDGTGPMPHFSGPARNKRIRR